MSARLQSLPGVSTGLGSAGVRKRIGGSAGHWRLAWRQGGCWAAGRMLGGRQLCIGGRAGHLAACCLLLACTGGEGWAMAAGAVHLAAGGFALAEEQGIWRLACLRSLPTGSENWHWRC